MVNLLEVVVLSIVQGITEWLPISSSGHLALLQNLFGFQNLSFDVFLHFASIFAILVIFWKDIIYLLDIRKKENLRYIGLLILALIPAGIVGYFFKNFISDLFSNMLILGVLFMFSGVVIYSSKFANGNKKKISWYDSLFIGIFQALAIMPGVSRSGFTISSGLFRGLKKENVIRFSFLMAIPLILGASLLELGGLDVVGINWSILIISFIITFLVSLFAIKILLKSLRNGKFYLFGIYNFILGLVVLSWSLI